MTYKQANLLEPGVYRLTWRKGGSSIALVGRGFDGKTWYAAVGAKAWRCSVPHRAYSLYLSGHIKWSLVTAADPVLCVDVTP